jgi:hypothetical protein
MGIPDKLIKAIIKKPHSISARCAAGSVALLLGFALQAEAYQTPLDGKALHDAYVLGQRNDQSTGDFIAPYVKEMTEGHSDLRVAEIEILTPFAQVVDDSRKNTSGYTEQQATEKYQKRGNTILVSVTLMLPAAYPQASNGNGTTNGTVSPNGTAVTGSSSAAGGNSSNTSSSGANSGGRSAGTNTGSAAAGSTTAGGAGATAGAGSGTGQPPSAAKPGDAQKTEGDPAVNSNLRPENFWQSFQFYVKQNGKNIPSKGLHNKPIYSTATKDAPAVLDGAAVLIEFDAKDVGSQDTVIEVTTPDGKTISATFDLKKLR